MKKVLVLMMTLVLMLTFVACDGDQSANVNEEGATLTYDSLFSEEEKTFLSSSSVISGDSEYGADQDAVFSGVQGTLVSENPPDNYTRKLFVSLDDYYTPEGSDYSFIAYFIEQEISDISIKIEIKKGTEGPYVVEISGMTTEEAQIKWIDGNTYSNDSCPEEVVSFMGIVTNLYSSGIESFKNKVKDHAFFTIIKHTEQEASAKLNEAYRFLDDEFNCVVGMSGVYNNSSISITRKNYVDLSGVGTKEEIAATLAANYGDSFGLGQNLGALEGAERTETVLNVTVDDVDYNVESYMTYISGLLV